MPELRDTVEAALATLSAQLDGPIAFAVSGGGDSLAMLYLGAEWAKRSGRRIFALTVDHGLRPEAAEEARIVSAHCKYLGLPHETLVWIPPGGHIGQARSRRARHQLLAQATRKAGGQLVLMAHTLEDQAETIAMRRQRSSTGDGTGGMRVLSVSPVWPDGRGVFIGRPCLALLRQDLRAYLNGQNIGWCEDPSNQDLKYERVRLRQYLTFEQIEAKTSDMEASQRERVRRDRQLGVWMEAHIRAGKDGTIRFDPAELSNYELTLSDLSEGLAWLLMAAAGSDRRAGLSSRMSLANDILTAPLSFRSRTLGGAWIAPRRGQVTLARDPGRRAPQIKLPQIGMVWDGRFEVVANHKTSEQKATHSIYPEPSDVCQVSTMARATQPEWAVDPLEALCLVPLRLKQVAFALNYGKQ